jgi:hypothetical protein
MRWPALVALSTVSVLALAGCASSGAVAPGGPATSTGSSPTGPLPTASASPSGLPEPTDPAPLGPGSRTVSGVVHQGAEPGCLILQSPYGQLELLDPKPPPHDGDQVRVTGHLVQAMSHCMQGRPFVVEKITIG